MKLSVEMSDADALNVLLHEVSNINAHISQSAYLLDSELQSRKPELPKLREAAALLYQHTSLVAAWMDMVAGMRNNEFFNTQRRSEINVFAKIERAVRSANIVGAHKKVRVNFIKRDNIPNMSMYRFFEVLPFTLLDNAIKYCPRDGDIDVTVAYHAKRFQVTMESLGPCVRNDEIERLTEPYFRSEQALASSVEGRGLGLFISKYVADRHGGRISFSSDRAITEFGGVPFGLFTVDCTFPSLPAFDS